MKNISFVPKEFNDIKLGYYETKKTNCSPIFLNEMRTINSITIAVPQEIICNLNNEKFDPVIPVCVIYSISLRRGLKYSNLSAKSLHIRKLDDETIHMGEIVDKDMQYEYPEPDPYENEKEKERMIRVEEAQRYSDEELEQPGLAAVNYMNINLMEYIDIPFEPGKYEVYLSFLGLESNHAIVEIISK